MNSQDQADRRPVVAVTRAADYDPATIREAVERQWSLNDPAGSLIRPGDSVLLKPNFVVPRPRDKAVMTDPAVILAVAEAVLDRGGKPFIGDSPGWGSMESCIHVLELEEPLQRLGVPFRTLDNPVKRELPGCEGYKVAISRVALDADKIINLPKLKTHQQLGATFAIKNMFGCVSGKRKAWLHWARGASFARFCSMLIGVYRLLDPALTLIDGVVAMEGRGPIGGLPRGLGVLVGGRDPIACEHVCRTLVGFAARDLPILRMAVNLLYGPASISSVKLLGDPLDDLICPDFQSAEQVALRFTLPRVCKSITKQILLLLKSRLFGSGQDDTSDRASSR